MGINALPNYFSLTPSFRFLDSFFSLSTELLLTLLSVFAVVLLLTLLSGFAAVAMSFLRWSVRPSRESPRGSSQAVLEIPGHR
jgi:hypothetical protein